MDFKIGDWVYYNFNLCQVESVDEDRVTSVNNGDFIHGGYSLKCFPISFKVKRISEEFTLWKKKLNKIEFALNRDVDDHLIYLWVRCCEKHEDVNLHEESYKELIDFCKKIKKAARKVEMMEVDCITIFRKTA